LPAQIGEVRNVFGKKKAREEVAMGVWEALKALAAERSVSINEEDENDASGYGAMSENGSARS